MYLICCMTLLAHLKVMQIYGWELFTVCHHGRSCKHRHCDDGDTVFFICHVTSRKHVTEFCEFMGGNPSWRVTTFPCLLTIG